MDDHHQPPHDPSRVLELLPLLVPRACGPLTGRIQVAIERGIALGLFPEGRLPAERQLSAALGVSRTALRAALDLVRRSGYAEQSVVGRSGGAPTRAAQPLTAEEIAGNANQALADVDRLVAIRRFLEPAFARQAAMERSSERIGRLIESQEQLAGRPSQLVHRMTDGTFHYELAATSGSDEIIGAALRARADLLRWRDRLPMEDTVGHSVTEHWAIIDAIQDGDADRAEAAMLDHLESSSALFTLFLRRYVKDPEVLLAQGQAAVARSADPSIAAHPVLDEFMTHRLHRAQR